MDHLDALSLQRATSEAERAAIPEGGELPPLRGMSWKTASHTWGLVTKMFSDACGSKRRELRIREDNPVSGVRGPDRGAHKAKAYLYPSEFLKLASSEDVPLEWRHTFTVTTYLYARAGEVNALDWKDVDLEHGVIHIHQAVNRRTGATTSTKSGEARRVPIEAELLPLLQAMHKASGGVGRVLATDDTDRKLSRQLQRCLKLAGVKRAELFDGGPHRKPLTFHDLRATGITWCAVRGDDPLRIMQRAGHATFSTTQIYIRTAENLRTGFGHVFPRLPASLVGGETRSTEQSTEPASADLPPPASPPSNAFPLANHRETREYRAERPPSIPGASTTGPRFFRGLVVLRGAPAEVPCGQARPCSPSVRSCRRTPRWLSRTGLARGKMRKFERLRAGTFPAHAPPWPRLLLRIVRVAQRRRSSTRLSAITSRRFSRTHGSVNVPPFFGCVRGLGSRTPSASSGSRVGASMRAEAYYRALGRIPAAHRRAGRFE